MTDLLIFHDFLTDIKYPGSLPHHATAMVWGRLATLWKTMIFLILLFAVALGRGSVRCSVPLFFSPIRLVEKP